MADVITRLKVESQDYDTKIKRATEQLLHMADEARRTGATFAYADKEEVAFVRSLGSMSSSARDARGQLLEMSKSIEDLTMHYRELSREEQQSNYGQALKQSIDELVSRAADVRSVTHDMRTGSSTAMAGVTESASLMASGFQTAQGVLAMFGAQSEDAVQVIAKLQSAMAVSNGLTQINNSLQRQSAVMLGVATLQRKALALADNLETAAKSKNIIVSKLATIAQLALNAAANANPYVLLASAIAAVSVALFALIRHQRDAKKSSEAMKVETKSLAERQYEASQKIAKSVGEVIGKYKTMQMSWNNLKSDHERNEWIKANSEGFKQMGVNIESVNDAEDFFVRKTSAVVEALRARARVQAVQQFINQQYRDAVERNNETPIIDASSLVWTSSEGLDSVMNDIIPFDEIGAGSFDDYFDLDPISNMYRLSFRGQDAYARQQEAWRADLLTDEFAAIEDEWNSRLESLMSAANEADAVLNQFQPRERTTTTKQTKAKDEFKLGNYLDTYTLGYWENEASIIRNSMGGAKTTEEYEMMDAKLKEIERTIKVIKGETIFDPMEGSLAALNDQLKLAQEYLESLSPLSDKWAGALENVKNIQNDIDNIQKKINPEAEEGGEKADKAWMGAAQSVQQLGSALQQTGSKELNIAGIIAQAIANVALGLGEALANVNSSNKGGAWEWIAAAISGTATMIGTIASIKSATSGYAEGGLILPNGSPYTGDNIVARLNAGEGVLTADGIENAKRLASSGGFGAMSLSTEIHGEDIRIALNNSARRRGGSRGEYAISK